MKGKWVWGVIFSSKFGTGFNSVYENRGMAYRKAMRMIGEVKKANFKQKVILQKIMYYKGAVEEDGFGDYCSICGGELESGEKLSRI